MKFIIWIILGIVFFILEIITPTAFYFTSLSIGFFLAGLSTFFIKSPVLQWLVFVLFSVLSILVIKLFMKKNQDGQVRLANVDALKGKKGVVLIDIDPSLNKGLVKVNNEEWKAEAEETIRKGERIEVIGVEGTHLNVKKTQ
jgi:membrane protein implicated in regulation of membrane protease activity